MLGLLYADNLILYGKPEENLKAIVGYFIENCNRRGLEVNAGESKVMVLGGEGLKCKVCIDWI